MYGSYVMSNLMVLERTSHVPNNAAVPDGGAEEFGSALSGSMRQSGSVLGAQPISDQGAFPSDQAEQVYAQGYLDGLRAAGLNDAGPPVADPAMMTGGGSLVGGLGPDMMGFYQTDPYADPYAMRSTEVGAPFGMQGMGPGVPDELAGAILFLERMMQLLTMLERLANQFPGGSQAGGMQYPDMMTPGGMSVDSTLRAGERDVQLTDGQDMSIMPVDDGSGRGPAAPSVYSDPSLVPPWMRETDESGVYEPIPISEYPNAGGDREQVAEPSPLSDLDGNIADGLPIDMNASEERATEDLLEEEAA